MRLLGFVPICSFLLVLLSPCADAADFVGTVRMNQELVGTGALVRLYSFDSGSDGAPTGAPKKTIATTVASNGRFQFHALDSGNYLIEVEVNGQIGFREIVRVEGLISRDINLSTAPHHTIIQISIVDADDDAKVFINGSLVVAWSIDSQKPRLVRLRPGPNSLEVRVFNKASYTGGMSFFGGHQPEGWRYAIMIATEGGRELGVFRSGEDRPAPNGPRFGREFIALRGSLSADPSGGVRVLQMDEGAWK